MPSYVASGADAKTGHDRTITFEADDDTQAAAVAKARGVFVSRVERRPAPPTVEYARPLSPEETSRPSPVAAAEGPLIYWPRTIVIGLKVLLAGFFAVQMFGTYRNDSYFRGNVADAYLKNESARVAYEISHRQANIGEGIMDGLVVIAALLVPVPRGR